MCEIELAYLAFGAIIRLEDIEGRFPARDCLRLYTGVYFMSLHYPFLPWHRLCPLQLFYLALGRWI